VQRRQGDRISPLEGCHDTVVKTLQRHLAQSSQFHLQILRSRKQRCYTEYWSWGSWYKLSVVQRYKWGLPTKSTSKTLEYAHPSKTQ